MKKRCTNSACRKVFQADNICPYCGKKYPRIPRRSIISHDEIPQTYSVELFAYPSADKLRTIKVIRDFDRRMSLLEAKHMVEDCPSTIASDLSREKALELSRALQELNAIAKITAQV